jgi:predicted choloylglycine hydrolase
MQKNLPVRAIFPLFLLMLVSASFASDAPTTQPSQKRPFQIVEIHGTSAEMGVQHGKQLADPIAVLRENYLKVYLGSAPKRMIAMSAARAFAKQISPDHLDEIDALAGQVDMSQDEAVLAQCFLDLTPMSACSTITLPADAAPDHVARFGRNLDFPSLNIADKYTTVFICKPGDGRYSFASIGWPGMIGVLSGMNEHGLSLANMEVHRGIRVPTAMPYTLLYRTVLEKCKTVDEAIDLLGKTPRQTPNNLMLMDANGHRAVVELTPEAVVVRKGAEGASLISTNHQRGEDADTAGRCTRYDCLHDSSKAEFGHIDEPELQKILAAASQGDFTLQTMVFEPANRVIYLSAGKNAARKPFEKIELGAFFKR